MDKLPYELIREILVLSNQPLVPSEPHNEFYHGLHAHVTDYGLGGVPRREYDILRPVQRQFATYRLICKDISPIALKLLLQDVVLCATPACLTSFSAFLQTKRYRGQLGAYTRRILLVPLPVGIDYTPILDYSHVPLLRTIRTLCPNLEAIEIFNRNKDFEMPTGWLMGLKHLVIVSPSSYRSSYLQSIPHSHPLLETLIISADIGAINSPIHFSHLKRLEIDTGNAFNLNFITAPRLEACTLTISHLLDTSLTDAHAFLKSNGRGLRFLRIMQALTTEDHYEDMRYLDPIPLNRIHDLAHACPRLEIIHVLPFYTGAPLHREPHPTLTTLILDRAYAWNLSSVIGYWKINENQFAKFDTVVFALGAGQNPWTTDAEIKQSIEEDPQLFAVTSIITKPHCLPVVIPPCASKELAAKCVHDPPALAEVSARRSSTLGT